ncbi:MAG: hypothetical protein IPG02_16525 [Ignavibacteria bacterium]|nr:hypothetical protein [Ignavibacteria bacterium]
MPKYLNYSEWSAKLDLFIEGNDNVLIELTDEHFEIDSGTAAIFYKKLESVYDFRKKQWLDKFNKTMIETKPKTDGELEFIFRNARSNLNPIISFINLKGIPKDLKMF